MEVKGPNRVSFPNAKVVENVSPGPMPRPKPSPTTNVHANVAEKPKRNVNITCKYDRKQMRVRLEVEEWMYDQLQRLYDCLDGEDAPIEIDIDDILGLNDQERRHMLKHLLKEATQPVDEFIPELLKRIQLLRKLPPAPSRVSMEMDL